MAFELSAGSAEIPSLNSRDGLQFRSEVVTRRSPALVFSLKGNEMLELENFWEPFKAVVLPHLKALPAGEWRRLRAVGADQSRYVGGIPPLAEPVTPETLVDGALCEDDWSFAHALAGFEDHAEEVGVIEGRPVSYIVGMGIYLWTPHPTDGPTMTLWITHPAYPPGY